ncbi:MAG: type 4a pilus biogenesis protein PilO [Planctomycetota bacterium]
MSKWTQKKQLTAIGVATALVCASAAGGVWYAGGLVAEVEEQVAAKRGEIAAADAKIGRIASVEKEVIILRENLGEYVKILPDDDELNDFVRMINQFGGQAGVRGKELKKKDLRSTKKPGRFIPIAYSYEMTATLWQALKFMNLVENFDRFVSITAFTITPGTADGRGAAKVDGEVVHSISVTMQTYQYNSAGSGKDVAIPRYEDRKEELRDEIWKRLMKIRVDRYDHLGQNGRRDILVDPRQSGAEGGDEASLEEQRKALERGLGWVESLREIQARRGSAELTLFDQIGLQKRFEQQLREAMDSYEAEGAGIQYLPYRTRWNQEVVAPLNELAGVWSAPGPETDRFLQADDIRDLIEMMADDCDSGQLEEARKRYEDVMERLAVPEGDPRHELAVQAKRWHLKATTALDFKELDLQIQGLVVNGTGVGRSGVLLNGEVYEEGEYVQDDLLVKKVEQEQVWFVFRGLTLVRTM